jgi:FkbM family methyltransferase
MIRRFVVSGLRRVLASPALGAGEDPAATELRRSLKVERRRASLLEAELEKLRRQRLHTERRMTALNDAVERLQHKTLVQRRQTLSADLLADILPLRAAVPPRLAADRALAAAREERLLEISSAYRAAIGEGDAARQSLQRIEISGIPWWIPLDPRLPERAERAVGQSFPFRALMQTREIAIGGVMLDLGANIGRTSITRALLGDVRAVYAAEPEPLNYACLVQNVIEHDLRGFVLPDRVAIGAERGELRLQRSRFMGGHRVLSTEPKPGKRAADTVAVQVWPLDEWMTHHGIEAHAVTFVKVDTQGFEVNLLRGATRLLQRDGVAWQIEIDPGLLAAAGTSAAELLRVLESHFTHAIDLGRGGPGPRVIPVSRLADAVSYLGAEAHKTDVLLYRMSTRPA